MGRSADNAFNPQTKAFRVEGNLGITNGAVQDIKNAADLIKTINWLDIGTDDERVDNIHYISAEVGEEFTETFTYSGIAGSYLISTITIT